MAKRAVVDDQEGSKKFPLIDYHVHLTEQFTIDEAVALSQERRVKFGIVEHPGPLFDLATDRDLERYIANLREYPVYVGLQPVYRLLAALALGSLWLFRPGGWLRTLLIAEALMLEDLLLYVLLPELFGLRHYVFYGGSKPEPVNGAELLGCPRPVFVVLTVFVSALMLWGLVACLRRDRGIARTA